MDEVVMKKTSFIAVIPIMLLSLHFAQADVSIVKNGSFEYDDRSIDYITEQDTPYRWCDVNLPEFKFVGALWSGGSATHGNYYLDIYTNDWASFEVNDMGTISRQVYLQDANEIIFDVTLYTWPYGPWAPSERSVVLLIDDEEVNVDWDPNMEGPDLKGSYEGLYIVEEKYKDSNSHKLSLGLKVNTGGYPDAEYHSEWDFVKFDTYCGGFGYLPEDFDQDCYVDMGDLRVLAEAWLTEGPGQRCDLFEDGIIDFKDFSLFAEFWKANSYWGNWGDDNCYAMELLLSDIDDSGEVDYGDILSLAGDWLNTGDCIGADLNLDGVVDFKDFAVLAGDWRQRSWLYGVQ